MIRTAFFGHAELSAAGLLHLSQYRDLQVVSVTCGRTLADQTRSGPLQSLAKQLGIPTMTLSQLRTTYPMLDLVISFSNSVIFPPDFLASIRFGCINMHPAPLPYYRGCHSIEHAIINGDNRFGASLHFCDNGIDTGPLIEVRWVEIDPHDVAADLWRRVDCIALDLLATHIPRVIGAAKLGTRVASTPQDQVLARYYDARSITGSQIRLTWPYTKILRYVRAMQHPRRLLAYFDCGHARVSLRYDEGHLLIDSISHVSFSIDESIADACTNPIPISIPLCPLTIPTRKGPTADT
jgi:methionyl-tRNA formyltransferase